MRHSQSIVPLFDRIPPSFPSLEMAGANTTGSGMNSAQTLFPTPDRTSLASIYTSESHTAAAAVMSNGFNYSAHYNTAAVIPPVTPTSASTEVAAEKDRSEADTPPEVNHWTEIMRVGWKDDTSTTNSSTTSAQISSSSTKWDAVWSDYDLQQIERYWDRIMPTVSYLGTDAVAKIYQALCVAYRAHRGQMRKSGEPFIVHPVEVSLLLSGLKMDAETVMSGLLHDTVEDTDLTFQQVETLFGHTVRSIVEGETKVSKLPKLAFAEYADEQAENLRQMFVAMTSDYRIIIVKLADRLHNMRTLRYMKPEKQIKISRETLDIFAPLAHRMGIWQFKSELEDTSFMYLYPQEYKRLNRRLRLHQQSFQETLEKAQDILQRQLNLDSTLQQQAYKVEVSGRTKEIYSLWHKMETKNVQNLDHIVDVVALRVVISPRDKSVEADKSELSNDSDRGVWLCYHALGLVQHLPGFVPVPTRVKDYISFPKPNGYQSLHTALILNGQTIEVQIRTSMMHQVAEYGMASHWAYTDDKRRGSNEELYSTPWLSSIKEWQNEAVSSRDFVDSVRRELLGKRVFVFLRNGKILNLARGATAIDAAFQIHTEVGLSMHGVEINGKPVPLSYELQNGDVVSILTGSGRPATDWMRYAKSRSTRSKLRSYFRDRQKESLREAGKILLMDYLTVHGTLIQESSYLEKDFAIPKSTEELEYLLPGKTSFNDVDELLVGIGKNHNRSKLHQIVSQLFEVPKRILITAEEKKIPRLPSNIFAAVQLRQDRAKDAGDAVDLVGEIVTDPATWSTLPKKSVFSYSAESMLAGLDLPIEYADPEHLCVDCLPVYEDEIVGTRKSGSVSIPMVHRVGCPHAQRAINQAKAHQRQKPFVSKLQNVTSVPGTSIPRPQLRVDSVSLRQTYGKTAPWMRRAGGQTSKYKSGTVDLPVKLQWSDLDEKDSLFLSEIVVHCGDRKLLLADCSEVVSETVEIIKTGSSTNEETATLVFLVRVGGLGHIQTLMDRLMKVRSVLSVERRFGSELR
jgi:RelA/SpoT family (p)ppGpp synthetase